MFFTHFVDLELRLVSPCQLVNVWNESEVTPIKKSQKTEIAFYNNNDDNKEDFRFKKITFF